jgi:hypothetical protein
VPVGCRDVFPPHPARQPKSVEQNPMLSASRKRAERPSFRGDEAIEEIDAGLDVELRPSLADRTTWLSSISEMQWAHQRSGR